MPHIEIRPARPEDRDAVLAFCTNTWEWGDYIEGVWDDWLNNPQGLLLVATADGQPVGVAHVLMLNETDAWFEGMRVDPNYRRQGIASALFTAQVAEAKRRGAIRARLVTSSGNTSALRLIERAAIRQVGGFVLFRAAPVTTPPKREYGQEALELATTADIDAIIHYLNTSNIFPVVGGLYYYHGFTAYSITDTLLQAKVSAQQVYLLRRWDRLDGLAIAEPGEEWRGEQLSLGYIDGTTESISLIAYALRRKLPELGLESIFAYVPDLIMVRDAFIGAEYQTEGDVFYTYEQDL